MKKLIIVSDKVPGAFILYYEPAQQRKISELLYLCSKNEMIFRLIEKLMLKQHVIHIEFTGKVMPSRGCWLPDDSKIEIMNNLSVMDTLQTLVFELCNALNPRFNDIFLEAFANAEAYAAYIEEGEYDSYCMAYWIYRHGMDNCRWPTPEDIGIYEESLSKNVFMEKVRKKCDKYNGAESHFGIYASFYNHHAKKKVVTNQLKISDCDNEAHHNYSPSANF